MDYWVFGRVGVIVAVAVVIWIVVLVLDSRRNRARLAQWPGGKRIICAECGCGFWASEAHQTSDGDLCCSKTCRFFKEIGESIERRYD